MEQVTVPKKTMTVKEVAAVLGVSRELITKRIRELYPEKMRSIYVRASLGFDLTELKNLSGLGGRAKRDGESITEIFVGIGLHY